MKGSRQTLEKDCIIISEFWPWGLQVNETEPSEYIEFMKSRGYSFFTLEGKPIKDDYLLRMSLRGKTKNHVLDDFLIKRN